MRKRITVPEVIRSLRTKSSRRNVEGMARYGITSPKAFGVSTTHLRTLARRIGTDHDLALKLWATAWYEARMLAIFIADPDRTTKARMNRWVNDLDNWAITDGACIHLFRKTPHAHDMVEVWCSRRKEFVRRAGFSMIATLAVHDKQAPDAVFRKYLRVIERHSGDERNGVKKAVNWALRQIGKRHPSLYRDSIRTAERISGRESAAARWIASDALREFRNPKIRARVHRSTSSRRRTKVRAA